MKKISRIEYCAGFEPLQSGMEQDEGSRILLPTMKPLDMPKKADKAEAAPAEVKKEEVIDFSKVEIEPLFADQVDFDTFSKSDFRAVKIKACEAVKKSKKLLKLTVDDGRNGRQIVSGIASWYQPEDLIGKKIVFVANLAPAKLCGELSEGMILACDAGENDVRVLFLDKDVPNGSTIR